MTMTEDVQSPNSQEREHDEAPQDRDNVQTLTDLFDQLDRAAFKRVLENRDARASGRPSAKVGNG
jgi:hypothetical protein